MKFFDWRLWISKDFLKTLKVKKLVWPWRLGIHSRNMKREDFCSRSFVLSFLSHKKHRTVKGGQGNTKEKFSCDAQLKILHLPIPSSEAIGNWYVSNVSIIFDCFMLLYYLFWMLMSFILHFYIIFVTNLLIGGPAQNCCFLPISEFRRKRISNGVQTEWNLWERDFRNKRDSEDLDPTSRHQPGGHEVGGRLPPQARPPPSWAPRAATDTSPSYL